MDRRDARVSGTTVDAVVRALFATGPLDRADLVRTTGLSRPSVSAAVADLLDAGIVEEVAEAPAGRGRPSKRVRLSTRRAHGIGIELGRRHVAVAIADATGAVVASDTVDADPASSLAARADAALHLTASIASAHAIDLGGVHRVAVGTPGPRFAAAGRTAADFNLARLERERASVAAVVADRFAVPVEIGNNTRYTALAEARRRGRGIDLVYLRVDEGVGGGIVLHGEPVTGTLGAAGEMGHVSVDPLGDRCPCGGRGCLELVSSLPAVIRAADARDLDDLREHATDHAATAAIERAATATGGVLAGVVAITNPAAVVVGGIVATLPGFLPRVAEVVRDAAPTWATLDLVIEPALADHVLGAVGAATAVAAEPDDLILRRKDA